MKPEKRLEMLEAFASSKPREFDGFVIDYLQRHEPPEIIEYPPTAAVEKKHEKGLLSLLRREL